MNSGQHAIIGTGAVAAAVGWMLQAGGLSCYHIGRSGPRAWSYQFEAAGSRSTVESTPPPDLSGTSLALVCVKAYDLEAALAHLALFQHRVTVIPFINGATTDLMRAAGQKFPQHLLRTGIATLGVSRVENDVFSLRSRGGLLQFGPLVSTEPQSPEEVRLAAVQSPVAGGPHFQWADDIAGLQKRKWLFNTVINSLAAARQLARNGDLLSDLPTLTAVFTEAYDLASSAFGPWGETRQALYGKMLRLIQDTQDNENSMAADVRLRRRTESDFLAGLSARDPGRFPLLQDLHGKISRRES
jgi:ketopantoate reductase